MESKSIKIVSIIDKVVSRIIVLFFVTILCVCLYAIYDAIHVRNEINIISGASRIIENTPDDERIAELQKVNSEIIAWISLDGTKIDYPVTQTTNNNFYLTHDYKKEYSSAGNIFADFRNNLLVDDYSVIYGHNMNGQQMFGAINEFEDAEYFANHNTGRIYLSDGSQYRLSVLYYAVVMNDNEEIYDVDRYAKDSNDQVLNYVSDISINRASNSSVPNTLLLLTTCYKHSSQRAILLVGYDR